MSSYPHSVYFVFIQYYSCVGDVYALENFCRFNANWLQDPKHRDPRNIETDSELSEDDKRFLKGIHVRNMSYVLTPSETDINYLEDIYSK